MDYEAHHCSYVVEDTDEALAFYRDELGFEVVRQWESDEFQGTLDGLGERDDVDVTESTGTVTYLSTGNFLFELVEYRTPPNENANDGLENNAIGRVHVCFSTPDVRSAYRSLEEAVEFVSRPVMTEAGGLMAKCYDPSGNLVEFLEPPDPDAVADDTVVDGFHHFGVNTTDLEVAIEFYRETFGWELVTQFDPPAEVDRFASDLEPGEEATGLAFLDAGGCQIELLEYPNAPNRNGSIGEIDVGRFHVGIRVGDVDEAYGALRETLAFVTPPMSSSRDAVVVKCHVHEGYTVEFIDPPVWAA